MREPERFETVVIGGGRAGLAVGYHLAQRDRNFVILEAGGRIGDPWRQRWDGLRVFTPARYDGLPGMRFPAPAHTLPRNLRPSPVDGAAPFAGLRNRLAAHTAL